MSNLGQPITRADGPAKVTGSARYAGDQNQSGQLYAVLVASNIAAGRVSAIDTRAALAIPGVTRVLVEVDMPRVHADLDKIMQIAAKHDPQFAENVIVVADDSHGVGGFGATGRGTEEVVGGAKVDVLIGTLGKAFGVNGGMTQENLTTALTMAVENKLLEKPLPLDQWADFHFQAEALAQLGGPIAE